MSESAPEQLRFPPVAGLTVRGDFDGGALSPDFSPMIQPFQGVILSLEQLGG